MNGGRRLFPGSLAVALALPAAGVAQEGSIAGRVTDMETGAPVASASVQVLGLSCRAGCPRTPRPSGMRW